MFELKIPSFFILFLTFLFIWVWNLKKNQKKYENERTKFWSKEQDSLVVRKKDIPDSLFYRPNLSALTFPQLSPENKDFKKSETLVRQLQDSLALPMLRFRDISNTDLRLQFGTANQTYITQAEENYDAFQNFLYDYAALMKENSFSEEAISALTEAVRLDCDSSKHYILLADLYFEQKNYHALEQLKILIEPLNPITKKKIEANFPKDNPKI